MMAMDLPAEAMTTKFTAVDKFVLKTVRTTY